MPTKHSVSTSTEEFASSTERPVGYEAPAVESVMTPESLEREVHYAGIQPASGQVKA